MSKTLIVTFPLLPEPKPITENGASKRQGVKGVQDFPTSRMWQPVSLYHVVRAYRRFLLHKPPQCPMRKVFPMKNSFLGRQEQ